MGAKNVLRTKDELSSSAEALQKAASQLADIALKMSLNSMDSALIPWSDATFSALDRVTTMIALSAIAVENQIMAKKQNRQSQYEKQKEKSENWANSMLKKQGEADLPAVSKRSPGRPKKS
jgi:hypothetical protein